jgi:hypothetical protein
LRAVFAAKQQIRQHKRPLLVRHIARIKAILNSNGANTATVTDSFFLNNSVSTASQGDTGGAIQNSGGTLAVANSTFVGKSAPEPL